MIEAPLMGRRNQWPSRSKELPVEKIWKFLYYQLGCVARKIVIAVQPNQCNPIIGLVIQEYILEITESLYYTTVFNKKETLPVKACPYRMHLHPCLVPNWLCSRSSYKKKET